jgi:hypothetical protein
MSESNLSSAKPNEKNSKNTRFVGKLATVVTAALASLCLTQEASAFRVMASVNTLSPARVSKADIKSDIGYPIC